jgi:tRNA synthetases class I (I, L, M and V)
MHTATKHFTACVATAFSQCPEQQLLNISCNHCCNKQVLQSMKASERQGLTTLQLRAKATEFALATVDKQRTAFKRYGVWGYWDEPYMTLQPEYEAAQIEVFGKVVQSVQSLQSSLCACIV